MLIKQNSTNKPLKIVLLGSASTGKSAITVRYLTKRFIGEYSSSKDFLYHQTLNIGNSTTEIEILDTSDCKIQEQIQVIYSSDKLTAISQTCLTDHLNWAEAVVIVYSICDLNSFLHAKNLIFAIKNSSNFDQSSLSDDLVSETNNNCDFTNNNLSFNNNENLNNNQQNCNNQLPVILLLGNKRDLEHNRQVMVSEVEEFALKLQILFYEVSAADSFVGISLAFHNLIREVRSNSSRKTKLDQICSLSKEDSLRLRARPYCCGHFENRQLVDCCSNDYFSFKSNTCARSNSSSSDTSLKCGEKFQMNSKRKSMTVSKMIGIVFGSKSARQKKRPSLSI